MYKIIPIFLLFSLIGCSSVADRQPAGLQGTIDQLRKAFAPDKRTDRVEIALEGGNLKGYTTVKAVVDSLDQNLLKYPALASGVRFLPDSAVGDKTIGIIKVSVANLRSKPGHSQELATQALMGSPIQLLDKKDNWYLVRTPDRYIAWLEPGAFQAMTPKEGQDWLDDDIRIYVGESGLMTSEPNGGTIISDLVKGSLVTFFPAEKRAGEQVQVHLPDGQIGWLDIGEINCAPNWLAAEEVKTEGLISSARLLSGRPYLWGGTSPKGMDCSGFTKMSYYLNGFVIPRDASQQVNAGAEVELTADFANLQPGDQLFFGRFRDDGSEKITHTGFYVGNGRFLHAGADNGRIEENSLLADDPLFAEHRLKSLLRARRLEAGTPGVVSVGKAFGEILSNRSQ